MKRLYKILMVTLTILFSISLFSCSEDVPTSIPTIETSGPTKEVTEGKEDKTETSTEDTSKKEEEKVETSKAIIIYLDIDWEEVTEAYFNDTVMEQGQYDNECEFKVEIEAESITKFDLDFKQYNSWWHVQDTFQSWNCDSCLDVDMKAGETYIVKDVNWTYQWDNEEQKWYTCTINKQ